MLTALKLDDPRLFVLDNGGVSRRQFADPDAMDRQVAITSAAFAPDGKRLVYSIAHLDGSATELRMRDMQDTTGSSLRTVFQSRGDVKIVGWPTSINRLMISRRGDVMELAWLELSAGTLKDIAKLLDSSAAISMSPDGRYVVFDRLQPDAVGGSQKDLFIADTATGTITPFVQSPSQDMYPVWDVRGGAVMFASNRGGNFGLWRQRVNAGRPIGEPTLVRANMGSFRPVGIDPSGTFYYTSGGQVDVYTAAVNLSLGHVSAPAFVSTSFVGTNEDPEWSPDGSQLLFTSDRNEGGHFIRGICIHDIETGHEQFLHVTNDGAGHLSPDGESLVFGAYAGSRLAVETLDLRTGSIRQIASANIRLKSSPSWMPNGRDILYINRSTSEWTIDAIDVAARTRRLVPVSHISEYVLSHHGDRVAWSTEPQDRAERYPARVNVTTLAAGTTRRIAIDPAAELEVAGWSRDDRELIVTRSRTRDDGYRGDAELLAFRSDGSSRSLGWIWGDARSFRLDPFGRAVAFEAGPSTPASTWVMRGFIPK